MFIFKMSAEHNNMINKPKKYDQKLSELGANWLYIFIHCDVTKG